eukprot:2257039-Prymnesium_polylepis.1
MSMTGRGNVLKDALLLHHSLKWRLDHSRVEWWSTKEGDVECWVVPARWRETFKEHSAHSGGSVAAEVVPLRRILRVHNPRRSQDSTDSCDQFARFSDVLQDMTGGENVHASSSDGVHAGTRAREHLWVRLETDDPLGVVLQVGQREAMRTAHFDDREISAAVCELDDVRRLLMPPSLLGIGCLASI